MRKKFWTNLSLAIFQIYQWHKHKVCGKPKGENIKLIIERNAIQKCFYIGDTQGDYNATKIAGIPFLYAKYGFGSVDTEVPFINCWS